MCLYVKKGAAAKRLFLPNEDKYWSKGITACAICDGAAPMFRVRSGPTFIGHSDSYASLTILHDEH